MNKDLDLNDLEKVTGGVERTVNTGIDRKGAAIRAEPRKTSR